MVDFYMEPKDHHVNPVGQLDMKMDQYYSSIYSKLYNHINNTVTHITEKEREAWNNKVSKDALNEIQDQLDQLAGDGDNSIKNEIIIEVTKQITEAIADLNLGEYAKKKYVDDAINNIKINGYITKSEADSTYLKIVDYTRFDADGYYTKAEIQNLLKSIGANVDYSIQDFSIKDNKLTLIQNNGGKFEVNIPTNGESISIDDINNLLNNYIKKNSLATLEINGNVVSLENGGTIKIPTGGGTVTPVDPTTYGYYKSYFKETNSRDISPQLPEDNKAPGINSGWVENAPNSRVGYYIWMTQVFINGEGQYGSYINPICLTGSDGQGGSTTPGEDGNGVNFIYRQAIEGEKVNNPGSVTVYNDVPVVPDQWNDHPSGVTKDIPYEYCSVVTSIKGEWGKQWSEPFVWSHYGQNGTDGDGVEYIFYAGTVAPSQNLPSTWTNEDGFQDREYIKPNSGWTDDPVDLETLGQGYKQWVCIRKKYADKDGQDPYWHDYSEPALWGYYAKDGVVSAVILDVVGETRYVYMDPNTKKNKQYNATISVNMYNSGETINKTLSFVSFKKSDGTDMSSLSGAFQFADSNVSVNFNAEDLSFDNDVYYILRISATPTSSDISNQVRYTDIQFYGISNEGIKVDPINGENSVRLDLENESECVSCDTNGVVLGDIDSTKIHLYDGQSDKTNDATITIESYTNLQSKPTIGEQYQIKDIVLPTGTDNLKSSITVKAQYKNSNYYAVYSILRVLPGKEGQSAVIYKLEPSAYVVVIDSDGNITPSTLTCNVYKQIGQQQPELANDVDVWYYTSSSSVYEKLNAGNLLVQKDLLWVKFCCVQTGKNPNNEDVVSYDTETVPVISNGKNGNPGQNGTSIGIYTTASAITLQDGSYYPELIGSYVMYSDGSTITKYTPYNSGNWKFQFKVDDGDWNDLSIDEIKSQGENGMLFKATLPAYEDSNNVTHKEVVLQEYVPIVRQGIQGLNGISYSMQLSNMTLTYSPNDEQSFDLQMTGDVDVYKIDANNSQTKLTNNDTNVQQQINSGSKADIQFTNNHWSLNINTTVQEKSSVIALYAYDKTGVYLTSILIPVSSSGQKGDKGDKGDKGQDGSTGQSFKGSPLRILGAWEKGKKYYDGKRDAEDGVFYQDVVLYNNTYYACINTQTGDDDNWQKAPDISTYFKAFTISPDIIADLLIANKAFIKELSSQEVVIFDDNSNIVAGMTSGRAIQGSQLSSNTNKGDVRIWAGELENSGDLTSAPFTVTNTGVLTCQNSNGNSITLKDGTIYFTVNGQTYHLGITNGKPDWIGGVEAIPVYSFTNLYSNQVSDGSLVTLYSSNGKYYNNSQLTSLANGNYYIYKGLSDVRKISESICYIGSHSAKVYMKVMFTDGDMSEIGLCGIGPQVTYNVDLGSVVIANGNYWHDIEDSQKFSDYIISDSNGNAVHLNENNISYNDDNDELYLLKRATLWQATGTNYSISHVDINSGNIEQSRAIISTSYV